MRRVSAMIRSADAQLPVDHRRIDEEEHLLAARRAGLLHQLERRLHQRLGQLPRVGDRRRRADERGVGAVVLAHAPETPQHVGEVAAEHAAIGVQLVDHHVAQVLEQLGPARVVRQDARVDHVGVAQHHVRAAADRAARVLRRVAVVGEDADLGLVGAREPARHLVQLGQLVLGQRLGREEIQRAAGRVPQNGAQDRRVVAERLAGCRGRRHHHVAPRCGVGNHFGLMAVQLLDTACGQHLPHAHIHTVGKRGEDGPDRGLPADGGNPAVGRVGPLGAGAHQPRQHRLQCDVMCRRGPLGGQHGRRI